MIDYENGNPNRAKGNDPRNVSADEKVEASQGRVAERKNRFSYKTALAKGLLQM